MINKYFHCILIAVQPTRCGVYVTMPCVSNAAGDNFFLNNCKKNIKKNYSPTFNVEYKGDF